MAARKKPARRARQANPCKRKRRNNSEAEAARALTEAFHGRPMRSVREVTERYETPTQLADLGRLVLLDVRTSQGRVDLGRGGNVRVAATGDGRNLYFVGGNQTLDLAQLGLGHVLPRDYVPLGKVRKIVYFTSKDFHNFEPVEYVHKFGEEGGEPPDLVYDTRNRKLLLVGGSYEVRREGIVN